jgi:hypothetical protein
VHSDPSCCRRNAKSAPDFFVGQVEVKAEDEHKPSVAIKASQRPAQLLGLIHVCARRRLLLISEPESLEEERCWTAPRHSALVRNDGKKPRSGLGPRAKR